MSQNQWVLASHNAGKIKELRDVLAVRNLRLLDAADAQLDEPEETDTTFTGNALLKAEAACASSGYTALADDSGLSVDELDGAPGVLSARWAERDDGGGRDFDLAMRKVHDALEAAGAKDRTARFICVIAVVHPDGRKRTYEGRVEGQIVWPPRGEGGFGYDAIFQPDGSDLTFAEMGKAAKQAISHRGRAMTAMISGEFDR